LTLLNEDPKLSPQCIYRLDKLILVWLIRFSALYDSGDFITAFARANTRSCVGSDAASAHVQTYFLKIRFDILFIWAMP
jgi:hypothetical protein